VEFMAAVLSNEVNNTDKISVFIGECQRMGIEILPPDVNRSGLKFMPEVLGEKEAIRYGMMAIKNVGEGAVLSIIEERERNGIFKSLEDFCGRVDSRKTNKKVLESLVKCGAFDWIGQERSQLFSQVDSALAASAAAHKDRAIGQVSLFDDFLTATAPPKSSVPVVPPWPVAEKLAYEKELLGFYVTGHPLDPYRKVLQNGKYVSIASLPEMEDKANVLIAGALSVVEKKFTKKEGKPFAIVTLEDLTDSLEVMIWNKNFAQAAPLLEKGNVVSISGRLENKGEGVRIVADEVKALKAAASNGELPLLLTMLKEETEEKDLLALKSTLEEFRGTRPVELEILSAESKVLLRLGQEFRVNFSPECREKLTRWIKG